MPSPHPNAVAGHAFVRSKTSIWIETATPFVEFQFELLTWPEITSSDPILETWSQALEVYRMKRKQSFLNAFRGISKVSPPIIS